MDRAERNELVEKNIGLVHACANKFSGKGVEYDDLFQAGCVGIIKAAENFDPERGFSFSTYAVPVILGEIKRIFRDGGSVKVGRALKEKARAAMREKDALTAELGCEPTVGQLAERLGSDVAQTAQLLNAAMPAVSLTACTDDGEGQIDLPVESPENAASELIALREVIALLDDRAELPSCSVCRRCRCRGAKKPCSRSCGATCPPDFLDNSRRCDKLN